MIKQNESELTDTDFKIKLKWNERQYVVALAEIKIVLLWRENRTNINLILKFEPNRTFSF